MSSYNNYSNQSQKNSSSGQSGQTTVSGGTIYTIGVNGITATATVPAGGGTITIPATGAYSITGTTGSTNFGWGQLAPLEPNGTHLEIGPSGDTVVPVLTETINGAKLRARLSPEHDITALEQLRISCLIAAISNVNLKPISYIKKFNLERHFTFTQE